MEMQLLDAAPIMKCVGRTKLQTPDIGIFRSKLQTPSSKLQAPSSKLQTSDLYTIWKGKGNTNYEMRW